MSKIIASAAIRGAYKLVEKMFRDQKPHSVRELSEYLNEHAGLTKVLCRQLETARVLRQSFSKSGKPYYQYDPDSRVKEIIERNILDFWIRPERIPYSPTFQW